MILPIVKYGHPALREPGKRIEQVTPEIQQLVRDMFETMYAAKGIGLAAPQVARSLQLLVIDVRGVTDRPSTLERDGNPADVDAFMPLALINPQLSPVGPVQAGPEGCLSFPEVFSEVPRPEHVTVNALDEAGRAIRFSCGGLLSRAIQHECDHLQGILFIDRMSLQDKQKLKPDLDALLAESRAGYERSVPGLR
jgi:peptide deformylase